MTIDYQAFSKTIIQFLQISVAMEKWNPLQMASTLV